METPDYKKQVLTGRLKELFGIPPKLITKLKYQIKYYNENPRIRLLTPDMMHKFVISLFAIDYFPVVSRNIRIDKYNQAVIMGGVAFNENVPAKMSYLKLDTDDVDLKIYTTDINYLEKNEKATNRILSILRFSIIIICMYLKQILELIKYFTSTYPPKPKSQYKPKHSKKNQLKHKQNKKQHGGTTKYSHSRISKSKISQTQQMKIKQQNKGILNDYKITVLLKKKNENNVNEIIATLDLHTMSYPDIFNKIMDSIDDVDLLITNKIGYNMKYDNVVKPNKFRMITFSDTKVIYPNIEHPAFYSYYFMHNKRDIGIPIEKLVKQTIPVDKIIETNNCGNNCRYTSTNMLIVDTALMLSYAELLAYEHLIEGGKILVPIAFLFKYYKYLTKYIRLFVIRKYNNGTLDDKFMNCAKKLWTYALENLKITTTYSDETDEINIAYKKLLNEFHQNLFINKTLLVDYPELQEVVDEYSMIVYYINNSRALFKEVDNKSKHVGESIESITIQMAEQELTKSASKTFIGGGSTSRHTGKSITLLDDVSNNVLYNDIELDNPEPIVQRQSIQKTNKMMINKVINLINEEITILGTLERTYSSKSKNSS